MKRLTAFILSLGLCAALFFPAAPANAAEDDAQVTQTLRALEIMVGDQYGNMQLERSVSRAEFAKLLVNASSQKDSLGGEGAGFSLFTDVKSTYWASEAIKLCLDNGWMIGYTDGSFRPDNTVTLEEACTAALRLVGFNSSNLSGSFPAAQLNKASAIGLRDDLAAGKGQQLTRGDCARLFYNLLTCKTNQGQIYAVTLGYSLDSEGKVDYMAAVKKDLKGPFLCDGSAPALGTAPLTVYVNDKLVSGFSWEKDDVYYYAKGYLWIYREQVYGQIGAVSPRTTNPESVSVGGKNYTLATDELKDKITALGERAVGSTVTVLLGMDGKAADAQIVNGPYVAGTSVWLSFTPTLIYRNGELSDTAALKENDVYYYSEENGTLWIYDKKVSGKIEALAPNVTAPTSVTVSGSSYALSGTELSRELSALNGKWTDRLVTLLLGMDGSVVKVLTDDAVESTYCGVIQKSVKQASEGEVETQVEVICTDGRSYTFSMAESRNWTAGTLVEVRITAGELTISRLSEKSLSGTVNKAGTRIGDHAVAEGAEILDTAEDGTAVSVKAVELAGMILDSSNVRWYTLDAAGKIDRLILKEVTGDACDYGLMTAVTEQGNGATRYEYLLGGKKQSLSVSGSYSIGAGQGFSVRRGSDGAIRSLKGLSYVRLTSLGLTSANAKEKVYPIADGVQAYLKNGSSYYLSELADINTESYTLTGYYDAAAGKLRVIVATAK